MTNETTIKKRHNHKYPNFLLMNWTKDPFSKFENRRVKYDRRKHMGEKGYYPDHLEDMLSTVEGIMSYITRKIISGDNNLSDLEIARIIIYVKIQAIRLENISKYINNPDPYFVGDNNFLYGVFSTDKKDEIIESTIFLVSVFLKKNIDEIEATGVLIGLSPIIWKSNESIFCVTDNAVFKEVDIDGRFLFVFMPISPKYAIVLSKTSYYSSQINLEGVKSIHGDSRLSVSVKDNLLINNFKHEGIFLIPFSFGRPKEIPIYELQEEDIIYINSTMMNDSKKIIFYDGEDEKISRYIARKDYNREIVASG